MSLNNIDPDSDRDEVHAKARIGSTIVDGLERFVAAVRKNHPELGPSVVIIAPEVNDFTWLDWVKDQWKCKADGDHVAEIKVQGSVLGEGADFVALCLLRALAVQLAHERGLVPISSGGRYYGPKYKETAEEMGLNVTTSGSLHGWSNAELTDLLRERYHQDIQSLEGSLVAHRLTEAPGRSTSKDGRTSPATSPATDKVDQRATAGERGGDSGGDEAKTGSDEASRDARPDQDQDQERERKDGASTNVGAKRTSRSTRIRKPSSGGRAKSKESKAWIEMRCDCPGPDARIRVREGFLHTEGADCRGCGCKYSMYASAQRGRS